MKTLRGKVVVITGGASGIGFALAERFGSEGAKVVVADIEGSSLDEALSRLRTKSADVIGIPTDVRDIGSVRHLADETVKAFGHVDILCNNAGVETGGSFIDIPERAWEWVMDVNFFGVLNGCKTFLPLLEKRHEAHIVNTASVAAFASATPTMAPYCASKMAVLGMTESLAVELRASASNVGVSLLAPGPVKTNMMNAERNIPDGVPAAAGMVRRSVMEKLARRTADVGIEASVVAGLVVEAVLSDQFFILPHAEMALAAVRRRLNWMESGEMPAIREAGT